MICLAVDPAEQLRRLERRNPRMLQRFVDEWIPLENRYFEATNIQAVADLPGRHRAAGRWVGRRAGMTYTHIRREGNIKEKTNV